MLAGWLLIQIIWLDKTKSETFKRDKKWSLMDALSDIYNLANQKQARKKLMFGGSGWPLVTWFELVGYLSTLRKFEVIILNQ